MERKMTQRWMALIAVVGLIPLLLAMRPVDEALLAAASKGDLGEITRAFEKGAESLCFTRQPKRAIKTRWLSYWTKART
jgi:hypothetical protein